MESDAELLSNEVDAEFARSRESLRTLRQQQVVEHRARQDRFALFEKACDRLQELWLPRLHVVRSRLVERLKIPVLLKAGRRQAELTFTSSLARVRMIFKAMVNPDVTALVLESAIDLVPSLMPGPGADRLEQRFLEADPRAIGEWTNRRIVEFVRCYLTLYECDYFLSGQIVEDPVNRIRFPRYAAASTLERGGKTLHFVTLETREEFERSEMKPVSNAQRI